MERILKAGAVFDWVTPVVGFVQTARNGRSVGFRIAENQGWNSTRVRAVLAARGVTSWGYLWVDDSMLFQVKLCQARFAEYLLGQAGAPYTCGAYRSSVSDARPQRRRAPTEPRTLRHTSAFSSTVDALVRELKGIMK